MENFDADSLSDAELENEFDQLFPHGFSGADVLRELAPEGWKKSPLNAVFHPSVEQVYQEALQMHRNISQLRRPGGAEAVPSEPTLDEVARDFHDRPVEGEREVRELVGQCLWDVFSAMPVGRIFG